MQNYVFLERNGIYHLQKCHVPTAIRYTNPPDQRPDYRMLTEWKEKDYPIQILEC